MLVLFDMKKAALALALACLPHAAGAVEENVIGRWIYAGSVRSTLLSRYIGPEGRTPDGEAMERAGRACGLKAGVDQINKFDATPIGDEPVVFGPFIDRKRVDATLACVRRYVPAAFITQARHVLD
ncbi:hypothetical protein FOHLNKBM_5970 [Methylobacterium longum]|nr:hypothetical protein FOHLNKBM_5970 [Methylobacterium longum]